MQEGDNTSLPHPWDPPQAGSRKGKGAHAYSFTHTQLQKSGGGAAFAWTTVTYTRHISEKNIFIEKKNSGMVVYRVPCYRVIHWPLPYTRGVPRPFPKFLTGAFL